jgi:hypothetical protein
MQSTDEHTTKGKNTSCPTHPGCGFFVVSIIIPLAKGHFVDAAQRAQAQTIKPFSFYEMTWKSSQF